MHWIKENLKRGDLAALAVFAFSLLVKLPFLADIRHDPAFVFPIIDCLEFNSWAGDILADWAGAWSALRNHPPLYPYFVAFIYAVLGYGTLAVAAAQYVLFSASTAFVYLIAARLFSRPAALLSCAFMTFYWYFLYAQSFLYSENLSLFLNLSCAACLLFLEDGRKKFLLAGLLLGLSAVCRAEIIVVAALISLWFLAGGAAGKKPVKAYALFLCGAALALAPVLARNYAVSGSLALRSQVGENLYMGNAPAFRGTSVLLETGKPWADFISTPDRALNRTLNEAENDRYFFAETRRLIREEPLAWGKLLLSKLAAFGAGTEFLRTEDLYVFNKYFPGRPHFRLVTLPAAFLSALLGLAFSLSGARRYLLLYSFLLSWAALVFFPLKTRYLMPVLPFLMMFSGYGVARLYEVLRRRQFLPAAGAAAFAAVFVLLSFYNPLKPRPPDASETYYAIARNYAEAGDAEKAAEFFLACLRLNPASASALNDLGALLMTAGRDAEALEYFEAALKLDPADPMAGFNYKGCLKKMKAGAGG